MAKRFDKGIEGEWYLKEMTEKPEPKFYHDGQLQGHQYREDYAKYEKSCIDVRKNAVLNGDKTDKNNRKVKTFLYNGVLITAKEVIAGIWCYFVEDHQISDDVEINEYFKNERHR